MPGYDALVTREARPWQILSGFFVSGVLMGLPGALLPLWDFHIHPDFGTAGNLFLALGLGVLAGGITGRRLDAKFAPAQVLSGGCFLSAISMLALSLCGPPVSPWLQAVVVLLSGCAAGLVNTAILEGLTPWYEEDPAGTSLLGGTFFGAGSTAIAWLLWQVLDSASPARWLAVAAVIPAAAGVLYSRLTLQKTEPGTRSQLHAREELRSGLAIMFALLLFFQFGSEWAIAGWLPVLLIDRLGISPSSGVGMLTLYWFVLTMGRLIASRFLPHVSPSRLLALSAFCAFFGCLVLYFASNSFGVVFGLIVIGTGFSSIYPLSAERIGQRFSHYHPAYFNGIFSFALLGGMTAPWSLGHLAAGATLQILPLAVLLSSLTVFALILLIWLGSKVSGG